LEALLLYKLSRLRLDLAAVFQESIQFTFRISAKVIIQWWWAAGLEKKQSQGGLRKR